MEFPEQPLEPQRSIECDPRLLTFAKSRFVLAAACVLALVLVLLHVGHDGEDSPSEEGYAKIGTVDKTTFWLQVDNSSAALRTTGKLGRLCGNREGLRATEPTPVCTASDPQVGSAFVFLADDDVHHVSFADSDGGTLTETSRLSAGSAAPGKVVLIVLVPGRAVYMTERPVFS